MPPLPNQRHARHTTIVHLLRSRSWVSASSLASRFGVSQRTIYRDIEELISHGIPINSVTGRAGGFRLATDIPVDPLVVNSDDALRLYIMGLLERDSRSTDLEPRPDLAVSTFARDALQRLASRIYFDTSDWYWRDEGSGHLTILRDALLTSTAIDVTFRSKLSAESTDLLLKPYGLVWKGGEWWLIAAQPREEPQRYQLNNIDRLVPTDLRFTHPGTEFDLQRWWHQALEDFGRGPNKAVLRVLPAAREEMLRLGLKPDSEVHDDPDGTMRIVLYVDKWQWLVPLIASFGADVVIEEPPDLRAAMREHHASALAAYDQPGATTDSSSPSEYRNDDSRLRATRARHPLAPRE